MDPTKPPLTAGSVVRIEKEQLQSILDRLQSDGYRTVGPRLRDGAIVYDDLACIEQLPIGYIDEQNGGHYRLEHSELNGWFDYVVGPHSPKNYTFPPLQTILRLRKNNGKWEADPEQPDCAPVAIVGLRSCDLHAIRIQDRVFLEGEYIDPDYKRRREQLFLLAVNCRRAAATCFCHSMGTGPRCSSGFDIALMEHDDHFVVDIGSARGATVLEAACWLPCEPEKIAESKAVSDQLAHDMGARSQGGSTPAGRCLDTTGIRDLLMNNLEHPRWNTVAERCLSCANCTMVCPTCFCSTVEEVADLSGESVRRDRSWASCFTHEHSYMSSGSVRKSTASQYRQWLTHKLATWIDQFDSSGCVGCGRCITWCPVGIDLTEEVAAIRESAK